MSHPSARSRSVRPLPVIVAALVAALLIAPMSALGVVRPRPDASATPWTEGGTSSNLLLKKHSGGTPVPFKRPNLAALGAPDADGSYHVLIVLKTPGLGRGATATANISRANAQLAERSAVTRGILTLGGHVDSEFKYLFNGLRAHIPADKMAQLRSNPSVARVERVTLYSQPKTDLPSRAPGLVTPQNAVAAEAVGADRVWAQLRSNSYTGTGKGVKVAVIDTGIDYTHLDFRRDGDVTFPTAKVVSGVDLVGDYYAPGDGGIYENPVPDSDPKDCRGYEPDGYSEDSSSGHGTHVAGTIAGYGVTAGGVAYQGLYNSSTDISSFMVAPGMAPLASLIAIRVFGCDGGTYMSADGIEAAVARDADIINLSLGSPYGVKGGAEQVAVDAAVAAGVTVVIAAGNDGPRSFLVGTPSTEDGALSVAALDNSVLPGATIAVGAGAPLSDVTLLNTNEYDFGGGSVDGPIIYVGDEGSESTGCSGYGGGAGKIVVIRRGECPFAQKIQQAVDVGAAGLIILQRNDITDPNEYPPFQGAGDDVYTDTLPVLMLNHAGEDALGAAVNSGSVVHLDELSGGIVNHSVATFSSGGPRWGDLALKPEVAAPGVSIVSARSGSGNESETMSGTSMATPVTAGVAALLKQRRTTWSPAAIKQALIGTASSVDAGTPLRSVGAGRVNAQMALTTTSTIAAGPNSTLSFGWVSGDAASTLIKNLTFTVTNRDVSSISYTFTTAAVDGFELPTGVTLDVYDGSTKLNQPGRKLTLARGKSKTLTARLTATISAQNAFPGLADIDEADLDQLLGGTLNAVITVTAPRKATLHVPVFAAFRHSETFSFSTDLLESDATSGVFIPYALYENIATSTSGTMAHDTTLDQYLWLGHDAKEGIGIGVGGADIKDVGFNTDPTLGDDTTGISSILISTWEPAWNQALNEIDVMFDADLDGIADVGVIITDHGYMTDGYADGIPTCAYYDAFGWLGGEPGALYTDEFLTANYDLGVLCSVSVEPGSSAIRLDIYSPYYWGDYPELDWKIDSYNGNGWDTDETSWYWADLYLVNYFEGLIAGPIEIDAGATSGSEYVLRTYDRYGGPYWFTSSLGWLVTNPYGTTAASQVYAIHNPVFAP